MLKEIPVSVVGELEVALEILLLIFEVLLEVEALEVVLLEVALLLQTMIMIHY